MYSKAQNLSFFFMKKPSNHQYLVSQAHRFNEKMPQALENRTSAIKLTLHARIKKKVNPCKSAPSNISKLYKDEDSMLKI